MDNEESCATPSKRGKTIMGLEVCVLEAMDDVFDATLREPGFYPSAHPDESVSDDDDVIPEERHELNGLNALGRLHRVSTS